MGFKLIVRLILANFGTPKFQNKQALFRNKHSQVRKIMVITEHIIPEFRVFKLIKFRIYANVTTRELILAKFTKIST